MDWPTSTASTISATHVGSGIQGSTSLDVTAAVLVAVGAVSRGFRLTDAALQVYVERDVFDEERRGGDKRPGVAKAFLSDLRDLKVGDLVVHVDHGIGEFVGLKQIGVGDTAHEFLELRYHGDDKLFVPVERLDLDPHDEGRRALRWP